MPSELASSSLHAPAARVLVLPSAEVREGDDVSLTCQVAGEPQDDMFYAWYKNSKWLQESPENLLTLPRIASAAAGSYHCRARSPSGTSISPAVALHVSCEWDPPGNQGGGEQGAGDGTVLGMGWCWGWCQRWDGEQGHLATQGYGWHTAGTLHGPRCWHCPQMLRVPL